VAQLLGHVLVRVVEPMISVVPEQILHVPSMVLAITLLNLLVLRVQEQLILQDLAVGHPLGHVSV
jgi:hypothetical protein